MLYSLGAFLETSVSDQDFFGLDTALLHKAKKSIWLLSNKLTSKVPGVAGEKI